MAEKKPYLSASHEIPPISDNGNRILLNRGRSSVHGIADIFEEDCVERGRSEGNDWLWNRSASRFYGDIIVLFKVDTGVLLGGIRRVTKELLLEAHVAPTDDMMTVFPYSNAEILTRLRGLRPVTALRLRWPSTGGSGGVRTSRSRST